MSCENHEIEIRRNFSDKYNRRILLICGVIRNLCDTERVEIRVNEVDKFETRIFNRQFKQIVQLNENSWNSIEIFYCHSKLSLKVLHTTDINLESKDNRPYDIQPLYLIPRGHNGKYQTTAEDTRNTPDIALLKIDLIVDLARHVISTKLYEYFQEDKTFQTRNCQIWNSNLCVNDIRKRNQWDIYDLIADEIIKTFGQDSITHRKFVVFLSSTLFDGLNQNEVHSQANIDSKTTSNVTLGGGFLCVMGSACMYSWPVELSDVIPAFNNKRVVDLTQVRDNSNYRRTYGGCFATSLGSLIHEMAHTFDLAHTETGLMGNDIDFVHRFFLTENLTEILPKRNVRNCSLVENTLPISQIQQRLTKIKKPGNFLEKYHEQKNNEMTFFEENCLLTLFHHKWFTQNHNESVIIFNENERSILCNTSPLVLIELRKKPKENSILHKYWSFHNETVNIFAIPQNENLQNLTIFAITRDGSIFKN